MQQKSFNSATRCGEKAIIGRLRSYGYFVQCQRVRNALHRVDPLGIVSLSRICLNRTKYEVSGSNALWHIDDYHKLLRRGFIIHGGIDGYSRLIMYLDV
jgi:hypothetical protein